ncbi:MAG: hypothetical protein R3C53_20495 [Pirellulaceae bacterium]
MLKTVKTLCCGCLAAAFLCGSALSTTAHAAERPTLRDTCDPRPDILAYHWYYNHSEYRRDYNRPRYYTGWLAHKIAPTSQEAMVWCENNRAGNYTEKHMPPMYKRYYAPKPWEVLQTGPRPDFPKANNKPSYPSNSSSAEVPAAEDSVTESPVGESEPIDLSQTN